MDPLPIESPEPAREFSCPLCGSPRLTPVYERHLGTAAALGRRRIRLDGCDDCGLLFQNPPPDAERLAAHYRSSRAASGTVWHEEGVGSARGTLNDARAAFVRRLLASEPPPETLLDVGCGWGELLEGLGDLGAVRYGLEPNARAAARARRYGVEVEEATLEENGFPDGAFDLVTCVSCLEHVCSIHQSVTALTRLVAPGGLLFVEVPDSRRPLAQAAEFFALEHLTHFTKGTLYRLLTRHGLAPVRCERPADAPTIRVGARRVGAAAAMEVTLPDDRAELREAVRRYAAERTALERELTARLGDRLARWRAESKRIAIYGAGDHTRFLLDMLDVGDRVAAILDGDPAKHGTDFHGWPVHAPEEVGELGIDAVVLSSRPFQEEMAARIESACAELGIEVVRCYPAAAAA